MAKFITTTGISYHLEQLIIKANENLVLISPFLRINERIKQILQDKKHQKINIRVVYGKSELLQEEYTWLNSMSNISLSYCKDLHAKCYLSESEAIITSMNLYEFSQVNNNEMGILIDKENDPELYKDVFAEAQRLIRLDDGLVKTVEKPLPKENPSVKQESKSKVEKPSDKSMGYCIRTGSQIPFNAERPMSYEAYKSWSKYGDSEYPEKYCHFSGEESYGETSVGKPILKKNWKKAKDQFDL